jgi:hypothetical protein
MLRKVPFALSNASLLARKLSPRDSVTAGQLLGEEVP